VSILHLPSKIDYPDSINSFLQAQYATRPRTVFCCFKNEVYAVSIVNLSKYTTSQILMQRLTNLIFLLAPVESIVKNPQSASLPHYFLHSLEVKYLAFKSLPPCRIHDLWTPQCSRLLSLPKMKVSYWRFTWPYFAYYLWRMLGLNECKLGEANWLE